MHIEDLPAALTTPSWSTDNAAALDDVQNIGWRFRFCGFGVYDGIDGVDLTGWAIPYWSVAVPLTLLSACLILWPGKCTAKHPQSREAAPTKIIEPFSDEGG